MVTADAPTATPAESIAGQAPQKLMLRQIEKLVAQGGSFSFETTLAGRSYARMVPQWQARGYAVHFRVSFRVS